jgi:hypothetical protein
MLQVMLRQDNGEYACIAEDERRYNLGEAKEELMSAMGLDTEVEGSAMQFLRRGYKVRILALGSCAALWLAFWQMFRRIVLQKSFPMERKINRSAVVLPLGLATAAPVNRKCTHQEMYLNEAVIIGRLMMQRSTWWEDAKDLESVDSWRKWFTMCNLRSSPLLPSFPELNSKEW